MSKSLEEFDGEVPENCCGCTFPKDFDFEWKPKDINSRPKPNTCIRPPLPDTSQCAFHADPGQTECKLEQLNKIDSVGGTLDGAIFPDQFVGSVDLSGITLLREVDLSGAELNNADFSGANLNNADLSHTALIDADLSETNLIDADLTGAVLFDPDLSEADLSHTDLTGAVLFYADLPDAKLSRADLSGAELSRADLSGANLFDADLSEAELSHTDLSEADLRHADLSETNLINADLSEVNLERATVVEVNLFDADLTKVTTYGARLEAVQINDGTEFYEGSKEYSRWWQREESLLAAPPRCGYDPAVEQPPQVTDTDRETLLTRAADTYRQFEELARRNTQPSLQSSLYVLRQDMQRKRYRERGQYIQWLANELFWVVFKHGESFGRLLMTAAIVILTFAGAYWQLDLIINNPDAPQPEREFVNNPFDAIYFSTLTFTTLGLGDFQPAAASQLGRGLVLLEATLGAILIATFVFVLGRRAAR